MELLVYCAALNAAVDEVAPELADHAHGLCLRVTLAQNLLNGGQSFAAYDAVLRDMNQLLTIRAIIALTLCLVGAGDFVYLVEHGLEILGSPLDSAVEAEVCNGEGQMRTAVILVASEGFPVEHLHDFHPSVEGEVLQVFLGERGARAEDAVRPVVVRGEGYAAEGRASVVVRIVGEHPLAVVLELLHEGLVLGELDASFEPNKNTKERRYIDWRFFHNGIGLSPRPP